MFRKLFICVFTKKSLLYKTPLIRMNQKSIKSNNNINLFGNHIYFMDFHNDEMKILLFIFPIFIHRVLLPGSPNPLKK